MSVIDASYFSSAWLNAFAAPNGKLYQRTAINVLNAAQSTAVDIGTLTYDKSQLDVAGQLVRENPTHYYKFTLDGDNLKLDFKNLTSNTALNIQVIDSDGNIVADNEGTDEQKLAYGGMTLEEGQSVEAGTYYIKVTYGGISLRNESPRYSIDLYSGTHFDNTFQTVAMTQTSLNQKVSVDSTMVFASSDALFYTHKDYNIINAKASSALTIGWISENKSALSVTSQITTANANHFYGFVLQKGSTLKLAFDNQTATENTTNVRIQVMDPTGYRIYADNEGTDAQKEAYAQLTSSGGLNAKPGQFIVKMTYGKGADTTKPQTYKFKVYAGESYSALYETTAIPETFDTAVLRGDLIETYNPLLVAATALYSQSQGDLPDIMTTLRELA
jgi:hypothetical protein